MRLKILHIKNSIEFKNISKQNIKFFAKTLILLCAPTPEKYLYNQNKNLNAENFCRIGYTVSKKIGNAVVRNRSKRRLREIFYHYSQKYCKNHYDYVIIARKEINVADFKKVSSDLKFCLTKIHKINEGKQKV